MKLTIEITSGPDRQFLVAEIWQSDQMIAEINLESKGELRLEIYPAPNGAEWSLNLDEFLDVVHNAKERLISG
ncbi:MAG: hypothetical protein WC423_15455 [Vulcanimicrobiota bacterium]